jgi:hypothetical protein
MPMIQQSDFRLLNYLPGRNVIYVAASPPVAQALQRFGRLRPMVQPPDSYELMPSSLYNFAELVMEFQQVSGMTLLERMGECPHCSGEKRPAIPSRVSRAYHAW